MTNNKYDWDSIILDYQSSDLSIKEYCLKNHINLHSFYNRKKWVDTKKDDALFQPVTIQEAPSKDLVSIRINSILVEVPSSLLPAVIRQLL